MRTLSARGTTITLLTAGACAVAAVPAVASTSERPGKGHDVSSGHVRTLHFTTAVDPAANTDVGPEGPGGGQVFVDKVLQGGRQVGTNAGVATVLALTETALTAQVVSTAVLPGGTLTLQGVFTEQLETGPTSVISAITGGTGGYLGAGGQCTATFGADDTTDVTCRVLLPGE